jgi:hypothetical protein
MTRTVDRRPVDRGMVVAAGTMDRPVRAAAMAHGADFSQQAFAPGRGGPDAADKFNRLDRRRGEPNQRQRERQGTRASRPAHFVLRLQVGLPAAPPMPRVSALRTFHKRGTLTILDFDV